MVPGAGSSTGGVPATAKSRHPFVPAAAENQWPALARIVSLSPRASQALEQGQTAAAPPLRRPQGEAWRVPPAAIPTLAAAGAGVVTGAAWPASGVSPAMQGLLDALVQQLTPAAPQRVVAVQPLGCGPGALAACLQTPTCPRCKPGWWARACCTPNRATRIHRHAAGACCVAAELPAASSPSSPRHRARCRRQLWGRSRALTSGLCAGAAARCGAGERAAATSACCRSGGPLADAAASVVYWARPAPGPQRPVVADAGAAGQRLRARGGRELTSAAVRAAIATRPVAPTQAVRPVSNPYAWPCAWVPVQAIASSGRGVIRICLHPYHVVGCLAVL